MTIGEGTLPFVLGGDATPQMSIEQGISRLISDYVAPCVRVREQSTGFPCITYSVNDANYGLLLSGQGDGTGTARFEFEILSKRYDDLGQYSKLLRRILNGFSGMAWDREILTITHDGESDNEAIADDGNQGWIFSRTCFYNVLFAEN